MPGINKRSNDPRADQKKDKGIKINPLFNTSSILKGVIDKVGPILGGEDKNKKKRSK